jgi:O-antigen ligase
MNGISWGSEPTIFDLSSKTTARFIGLFLFILSLAYTAVFLFNVELGEKISVGILLVGLISFFFLPSKTWLKPPLILMLLAILWLVIAWAVVSSDFPGRARSGPAVEDFIDKFLFLFIGLALAGSRSREWVFGGILASVIVLLPWVSGSGVADLMAGLQGERVGFGLNPIRAGMLAAFLFIFGSVFFLFELFSEKKRKLVIGFALFLMVWSLVLAAMSQTRAVFVALLVVLVVGVPFVLHRLGLMQNKRARIRFITVMAVALTAVVGLDYALGGKNMDRIQSGFSIVPHVINEGVDELPQSSWGIRVIMLKIGVERFSERPIWGWGYRSSDFILQEANASGLLDQEFNQFHNSYLEVLVEYGVLALVLLLSVFFYLISIVRELIGSGHLDSRIATASLLFFLFMLIFSLFDGILVQGSYGQFIFNCAGGLALSMHFRHKVVPDACSSRAT